MAAYHSTPPKHRIIFTVIRIFLALAFAFLGGMKLIGAPMMVTVFEQVGLGQWFRYVTGAIEVLGATLLLLPRFIGVAALLLAVTAVGAIIAHLTVVPGSPAPAIVLLSLSSILAWSFRLQTFALTGKATAEEASA